jgi:hypothetical protein
MGQWTKDAPCSNCGAPQGKKLQCEGCQTVGCQICIGSTARGICKICKKITNRRPL